MVLTSIEQEIIDTLCETEEDKEMFIKIFEFERKRHSNYIKQMNNLTIGPQTSKNLGK